MTDAKQFFSIDGELSKVISGYQARSAQVEMATAIADAIEKKQNLIAEAGTGTGKTFAYLVPAILSGKNQLFPQEPKTFRINYLTKISL